MMNVGINKARPIRLGVVVTVLLFAPLLRSVEPVYQGKELSEWLEEFSRVGQAEINHDAENAIIGMGTNALPFLVAYLSSEDSPFQLKLELWYNSWSPIKLQFKPAADRHGPALMGLRTLGKAGKLGPAAKPYIPEMSKLLKKPDRVNDAALALLYIGPESIRCLTDALDNTNETVRVWAALALEKLNLEIDKRGFGFGLFPSSASGRRIFSPAFAFSDDDIAAFEANLKSTNAVLRGATVEALGKIHITSWNNRIVPLLLQMVRDSDDAVRKAVVKTLRKLDPEGATNAGVK